MKPIYKIGEVAKAVGVNVQTLRYYEQLGLLKPTSRRESGYREYSPQAIERLTFIKKAQELGFTLSEISELLKLRVSHTAKCKSVKVQTLKKIENIEGKISVLQKMKKSLESLVQSCDEEKKTEECPILNSFK